MVGYADDFSMSNNAIDAYNRGLRPRSKWGRADILDVLPANARAHTYSSTNTRSSSCESTSS